MRLLVGVLLGLMAAISAEELHGAGATFPAPLYQKWFQSYEQEHAGIHISYEPIGSTAGTAKLREHAVDFAASDIPVADERYENYASVVGAVVPVYNLPGFTAELRFPPEALAGIYLGTIRKWNDPVLAHANPHAHLPNQTIAPVHRTDGSGTTYVFTEYLARVSPNWKEQGATVVWPTGQGAEGNEGVAQTVGRTPYSLGYVEFIYALQSHVSFGSVKNGAGRYVNADLDSIGAAAAAAGENLSLLDAPGESAYPMAAYTYFVTPRHCGAPLRDFLEWMLGQGQKQAAALGYAPLPEPIAARQRERLKSN